MSKSTLPDDAELRRLYIAENLKMARIAEMYGVSTQRVHQRIKQAGIKRPKRAIERSKLQKLYVCQGLNPGQISKILGFERTFIRTELLRHNIPLRGIKKHFFDRRQLYRMYVTNGMLMSEIAKEMGCSTSTVQNEIIRNGITERHATAARRPPPFTREQLYLMYVEQGLKVGEISEAAGCTHSTVRYWLYKHGIAMPTGRYLVCKEDALRKLYIEKKMTVIQISEKIGVGTSAIYYALQRYGIPIRPHKKIK